MEYYSENRFDLAKKGLGDPRLAMSHALNTGVLYTHLASLD